MGGVGGMTRWRGGLGELIREAKRRLGTTRFDFICFSDSGFASPEWRRQAALGGDAFPSGAWERQGGWLFRNRMRRGQ